MARGPSFRWLLPAGLAVIPAVPAVVYAVQYMTIDQAQHAAFPSATEFRPVAASRDALTHAIEPSMKAPEAWSPRIAEVWGGGRRMGWMVVDQVIGKIETITFSVAIGENGAITSVEILDYRESHGDEVRLPAWRRQFAGKRVTDPVTLDRDIRNISGATLSCRHVTEGVKRALLLYAHLLAAKT